MDVPALRTGSVCSAGRRAAAATLTSVPAQWFENKSGLIGVRAEYRLVDIARDCVD